MRLDQPSSSERGRARQPSSARLRSRRRRRADSTTIMGGDYTGLIICTAAEHATDQQASLRHRRRRQRRSAGTTATLALLLSLSASLPDQIHAADEAPHNLLRQTRSGVAGGNGGGMHNDRGDAGATKGNPSSAGGGGGRDDIFDHSFYDNAATTAVAGQQEASFQRPILRDNNNIAPPSLKLSGGGGDDSKSGQQYLDKDEAYRDYDRPIPSAAIQQQQKQKQQELATCMSTLANFALDNDGYGSDGYPAAPANAGDKLITKDGILDLLSDAAATAATSASSFTAQEQQQQQQQEQQQEQRLEGTSRSTPFRLKWTDLPLSLVMQYNYASCHGAGMCTAGGEGVALIGNNGDDAALGAISQQPRSGNVAKYAAIRRIDWPLRMLCREVTEYARELASSSLDFDSDDNEDADTVAIDEPTEENETSNHIELRIKYVVENISYTFYHSTRYGRTGLIGGGVNSALGRIRQRGMLKRRLIIATEEVIREYLGCSMHSMEEEDIVPLLDEEEDKSLWVHRGHTMNTEGNTKGKQDSQRRDEAKGNIWPHRSHSMNMQGKKKNGNAASNEAYGARKSSGGDEATTSQTDIVRTKGLESAVYGGCGFEIGIAIDNLQRVACQDKDSSGCALVESSVYFAAENGQELLANGSALRKDDAKDGLLNAIQQSMQSGYFQQLMIPHEDD